MKKILVVEDHKDSCLWIAAVLRQCGYESMEAADGAVAVRMARKEQPDLILLDLHLPAGGGEFVMESLKRQPELAHIPIIIMTGDPDVDRTQMKLRGAVEVYCKPMDVHAFLQTIRRTLNDLPAAMVPAQVQVRESMQVPVAVATVEATEAAGRGVGRAGAEAGVELLPA